MVGVVSLLLVVAIALVVATATGRPEHPTEASGAQLAEAVTGTTDHLTPAESLGGPALPSSPGRYEPSRALWLDLLARLEPAVNAAPTDVNLKRKLAITYYNLGMLNEAAEVYEELIALDKDPVLRNRLGNTLRDMGETAAAEAEYRAAIAADPSQPPPYLNLAELLWRQGEDDKALALLQEGLRTVPEDKRPLLQTAYNTLANTKD